MADEPKVVPPEKEPIIEGGPDIKVETDLNNGQMIVDNPPKSTDEITKLMDQLKADKEDFDKEREAFRKEWDSKVDEIESLKDLYETPNIEDPEETVEAEIETPATPATEEIKKDPIQGDDDEFMNELKKEILGETPAPQVVPKKVVTQDPNVLSKLEQIEVGLAEIRLKDELREAQIKFPKMDRAEVLLGIERDPKASVIKLAEDSEKNRIAKEKQIRDEIESQIRAEGGLVKTMPSHPGMAGIPTADIPAPGASEKPWDKAKREAKVDLGIQ